MRTRFETSPLLLARIAVMTFAGEDLGHKVGATWQFAAFAVGVLLSAAAGFLPLARRVAALEKKAFDLGGGPQSLSTPS